MHQFRKAHPRVSRIHSFKTDPRPGPTISISILEALILFAWTALAGLPVAAGRGLGLGVRRTALQTVTWKILAHDQGNAPRQLRGLHRCPERAPYGARRQKADKLPSSRRRLCSRRTNPGSSGWVNDGGKPKVQVFTTGEVVAFMVPLQRLWTGWSGVPSSTCSGSLKNLLQSPSPTSWTSHVLERATCSGFCFVLLVVVLFSVCFLSDTFNVCQL